MAGTAKNYDAQKIIIGPADVWLNVAIPGAGGRITLHTDGTPDATANPNAVHLGLTKSGSVVTIASTYQPSEADELLSAYRVTRAAEQMMIEGEFLQVMDFDLLELMSCGAFTGASGSGYEQLRVGGKVAPTYISLAVIFALEADPTKFGVAHIYKALNTAEMKAAINRKEPGAVPFKFEAYSVGTRTAGDQLGSIWKQV